jgi:hypothetical protein
MNIEDVINTYRDMEQKYGMSARYRESLEELPALMAKVEDLKKLEAKLQPLVTRLKDERQTLLADMEADRTRLQTIRQDLAAFNAKWGK